MKSDDKKEEKRDQPTGFDFEVYRQEVIKGLMQGQPLTGIPAYSNH